jgi:hypothetical protein
VKRRWIPLLANAALFALNFPLTDARGLFLPTEWTLFGLTLQGLLTNLALCRPAPRRAAVPAAVLLCASAAALAVRFLPLPPVFAFGARQPVLPAAQLLPCGLAAACCLSWAFASPGARLRKTAVSALFLAALLLNYALPRAQPPSRVDLSAFFLLGVWPLLLSALCALSLRLPKSAPPRRVRLLRAAAALDAILAAVFLAALVSFCFAARGRLHPAGSPVWLWSHRQPLPLAALGTRPEKCEDSA